MKSLPRAAGVLAAGLVLAAAVQLDAQDRSNWKTDFSRHTVPLDEIVPGGPPKDGIPSLDAPKFTDVPGADRWLEDSEPVMIVERTNTVHIYPIQILIWHEIVNDRVDDLPVAVTFCPLCNTAIVFDRRLDGTLLDFGTTGRLRHSDMVMYDRQTESWWQQATGEGIVGDYAGRSLEFVPSQMIDWERARELHPEARVLSRDTGHNRPYGRNPYAGYDRGRSPIRSFFRGSVDTRLPAMERIAAVKVGEASAAYPFTALRRVRVVNDTAAGVPITVFWMPGASSALDAETIADGRDVGSSAAFIRRADGRLLTFERAGNDRFRDRETRSEWTINGRAVAGPLQGSRLQSVIHGDYFWFAWAVFRPDTRVWRP